eukprot:gene20081-27494_t
MLESLPFLAATYVGQPVWLWIAFLAFIGLLLWLDLGVVNNRDGVVAAKKSAAMWASFAGIAIAFGAWFGGSLIDRGFSYGVLPWVGVAGGAAAVAVSLASWAAERR